MTKFTKIPVVQDCTLELLSTIDPETLEVIIIPPKEKKVMHYASMDVLKLLNKGYKRIPCVSKNPNYALRELFPDHEILLKDKNQCLRITDIVILCTSLFKLITDHLSEIVPEHWDKKSPMTNDKYSLIMKTEKLKPEEAKDYMIKIPDYEEDGYNYYITSTIRVSFFHKVPAYGLKEFDSLEIRDLERHEKQFNLYKENIDTVVDMLKKLITYNIIEGHAVNNATCSLEGILRAFNYLEDNFSTLKTTGEDSEESEPLR